MVRFRSLIATTAVLSFTASLAFAEGSVQQKTQVHFGGVIGGIANVFGGKATREGITSTTAIKGNRRLTTNDRSGELVDLSEEKIYRLDYNRKTYEVVTFAELRKQYEDARKQAAEEAKNEEKSKKKEEGPEYEVDFDIKETGQKQTIGGYDTKQVIVTTTVREKGKKLEQSGGAVLTADMWMGPKIAALREIGAFQAKYFKQLYGDPTAEMQQMAVLMATTPTFAKAMKEFAKKRTAFEGDAVRTTLTFETVAAPGQQAAQEEDSSPSGVVGGLLRNAMKKRQEKKGEAAAPGRSKLFESTTELVSASTNAGEVGLPAGFKAR
ncbi:MAG: hypothetical protein M3Q69_21590 [Acidobacteriota bacterium]|nr:hypothetical protein [Acidobacteriota bacterium]